VAAFLTSLLLVLGAVFWLLPWLGRLGQFNAIIERVISSSLQVPVSIENIDTEPLSHITVTRLQSVNARAEERFSFRAGSIAVYYDPVELFSGRIRQVVFEHPEIFINLDADLSSVFEVPEAPSRKPSREPSADAPRPRPSGDRLLPFTMDRTTINEGTLILRINGRDLELSGLKFEGGDLGKAIGESFELSVQALGASLRASGTVDVILMPGQATRYVLHSGKVRLETLPLQRLLAWFASKAAPAPEQRGVLSLEGNIDGTWPEKVILKLSSEASAVSSAAGAPASFRDANIGLKVEATVLGDLERVGIALSSRGRGSLASRGEEVAHDAGMEVKAELRRFEGEGGVLHFDPSRIVVSSVGEVRFSGEISSLFGSRPPVFDLSLSLPDVDAGTVVSKIPAGLLPEYLPRALLMPVRGKLSGSLHLTGNTAALQADGSLDASTAQYAMEGGGDSPCELHARFQGLEFAPKTRAWRLASLDLETTEIPAAELALGAGLNREEWALAGKVQLAAGAQALSWPPDPAPGEAHGKLFWSSGSVERKKGLFGATAIQAEAAFDARLEGKARSLGFELEGSASLKEFLAGSFYADLEGKRITLRAKGSLGWNEEAVLEVISLDDLEAVTPITGPLVARGSMGRSGGEGEFSLEAGLDAREIPTREAFDFFLRDPLKDSFPLFEEGALAGTASLLLSATGMLKEPRVAGRLSLEKCLLSLQGLKAEELDLELPFVVGSAAWREGEAFDGFLRARKLEYGPLAFERVDLPFWLADGSYALLAPSSYQVFGGVIEIKKATLSPGAARGPAASVSLEGRNLGCVRITTAYGLPRFRGKLNFDLEPIELEKSSLRTPGTVVLKAFGGEISLSGLSMENDGKPYAHLTVSEGHIRNVRLSEIGDAFGFGVMSGVLQGEVRDLAFTGGELTSFEIDIKTVPVSGVPQYLNRQAIESIRHVISGPLGALEETFFSKFHYSEFGLWCKLQNGVFRLRGKHQEDGTEYLMHADWYQFPKVSIINANPDKAYSWKTIVSRLRAIYEKDSEERK
jgi:hypothetical protein